MCRSRYESLSPLAEPRQPALVYPSTPSHVAVFRSGWFSGERLIVFTGQRGRHVLQWRQNVGRILDVLSLHVRKISS
jgi:hypothetical protein